jgi:outer membrane protein TolC
VNARPDLRAADAEIGREAARHDLARREGRADVSLAASYMRTKSMFPQLGLTPALTPTPIAGTFDMFAFGATVMLPWRNGNQGAVAASAAAVEAATYDRAARRLAALNEIAALSQREAGAQAALGLFGAGLRDLASRNLDVLRESYQLGRATLLDVLTETRRYLDVEMAYADAQLDLALARVALNGALGDIR